MEIKFAEVSDAPLIHGLMIKAFMEYKDEIPPSSALEETIQSISNALETGEQALIYFDEDTPVGMVRFQLKDEGLYFYRLSVIPDKQRQGIAKKLINSLENYANKLEIPSLLCKVRMTIPKNINLYRSMGFDAYEEEIVNKPNGINIKVVSMKKLL